MESKAILRVVLLGALAILGILGIQSYWIYQSWSQENRDFDQRVTIALREVAEKMAAYNDAILPANDVIRRESPNYYIVNIEDVIDANVLEHFLYATFSEHALYLDFEYAVFDCHTRDMVYGNYCAMGTDEDQFSFESQVTLPKYDEFTYYFGIRFPSKRAYLFSQMGRMWIVTGIMAFTLLFFAYALYVILGQKRYAEMQKDFINNMTHEFKTPISSIKLSSDFMKKSPAIQSDKRLSEYVDIIGDQNQRLNNQVEQVLSLAKLEKDQFQLKPSMVDLSKIIEEITSAHQMKVQSKKGSIKVKMPSQTPKVYADRSHLLNVVNNLVDNAIKYSGKAPEVVIAVEVRERDLVIRVKDRGEGIPKEEQRKVTRKFYRISRGNIHDVKGFGLGLYYVKNICQSHGWKFSIDSREGKGTIASIFIPQTDNRNG